MKSLILFFITIISALWVGMLVTNTRVLVEEAIVMPGQTFYVEGYGDLGRYNRPSIACKYFNGRKTLFSTYWYSPDNQTGKDSCPFIKMVNS